MPKEELVQGFLSCVVPNEGVLRFPVGTVVLAKIGPEPDSDEHEEDEHLLARYHDEQIRTHQYPGSED